MRIGIIDLGTNSVRFFVFEYSKKSPIHQLHKEKHMVRLGDSLFHKKRLNWKAYRRTVQAFEHYKDLIKEFEVEHVWAVATSAVRTAADGHRLLDIIKKHTDISVEIISGQREAELIAQGVLANVELPPESVLLVDIGGGSTEISRIKNNKVKQSFSLELGAARCQQLYLQSVPPMKGGEEELRKTVRKLLKKTSGNMDQKKYACALGTSGSIRAVEAIKNGLDSEEQAFSHHFLKKLLKKMRPMKRKDFATFETLEERRIDLILSAVILLDEILNFYSIDNVEVTQSSLKDGLIADFCKRLG